MGGSRRRGRGQRALLDLRRPAEVLKAILAAQSVQGGTGTEWAAAPPAWLRHAIVRPLLAATWNTRSFNTNDPLAQLYGNNPDHLLLPRRPDVIYLQECRRSTIRMPLSEDVANFSFDGVQDSWARMLNGLPHGHSRAHITHDCGIIINNRSWRVLDQDSGDNWVRVDVKLPEPLDPDDEFATRRLTLLCVHSTPDRQSFWSTDAAGLCRYLSSTTAPPSHVIIGGDFNSWANNTLDNTKHYAPTTPWSVISPTLDALDLVDGYRVLMPLGREVTRLAGVDGDPSGRRLDAIWVPRALGNLVTSYSIVPTSASDHHLFSLSIGNDAKSLDDEEGRGPSFWRLHEGLWHSARIARAVRDFAAVRLVQPVRRFGEWLEIKRSLRSVIYHTSRALGPVEKRLAKEAPALREQIAAIEIDKQEDKLRLPALLSKLRSAEAAQRSGVRVQRRSRQDAHAIFRPRFEARTTHVPNLERAEGGRTTSSQEQVQCVYHRFAAFLSRLRDLSDAEIQSVVTEMSNCHLRPQQVARLGRRFTVAELREALARLNHSAALGLDGIPYSVYEAMPDEALEVVISAFNSLLEGEPMPDDEPAVRATLLPKGWDDLHLLENWRGVTVPSCDYRLLARMIATRLQECAATLHPRPTQSDSIKGRSNNDVLLHLLLLQEQHRMDPQRHSPVVLLYLDQSKAFDRVNRQLLWEILREIGAPQTFLNLMQSWYDHPTIKYQIDGHWTEPIAMHHGLMQGCPASPLLFNLSLQPLLNALSRVIGVDVSFCADSPVARISVMAYVDDILAVIKPAAAPAETGVSAIPSILKRFERVSNSRINYGKSFFTVLSGVRLDDDHPHAADIAATCQALEALGLTAKSSREMTHLGLPAVLEQLAFPEQAFAEHIARIVRRIAMLEGHADSDLFSRADFINSHLLPKLWQAFTLCPLPLDIERKVMHAVAAFLFLGKRNWIPRELVLMPRRLGGLGVIPTEEMLLAHTLAIAAPLLTGRDQSSRAFQRGLHDYIVTTCRACPALLLCRYGLAWRRMFNRFTVQSSTFARVIWALGSCELSLSDDWDAYELDEILALPWYYFGYGAPLPEHDEPSWPLRSKMWTFADILWYNDDFTTHYPHPLRDVSGKIVPAPPYALRVNYREQPHRYPKGHPRLRYACSYLHRAWPEYWPALPPAFHTRFKRELPRKYRPHPDLACSRLHSRVNSRPFDLVASAFELPWRHLVVNGTLLTGGVPVKKGRRVLASQKVRTVYKAPEWNDFFSSTPAEAEALWSRLHDLKLPSAIASDNLLFQTCRAWNATQPPPVDAGIADFAEEALVVSRAPSPVGGAVQEQPSCYDESAAERKEAADEEEIVARLATSQAAGQAAAKPVDDEPETDDEEEKKVNMRQSHMLKDQDKADDNRPPAYHVLPCPFCKRQNDNTPHGYYACTYVQELWQACRPTLVDLLGDAPPPDINDARNIVLGWPDFKPTRAQRRVMQSRHQARFLLWRCCVVHEIAQFRYRAFRESRQSGEPLDFSNVVAADFALAVRKTLIKTIEDGLPSGHRRDAYIYKWIVHGRLATLSSDGKVLPV